MTRLLGDLNWRRLSVISTLQQADAMRTELSDLSKGKSTTHKFY